MAAGDKTQGRRVYIPAGQTINAVAFAEGDYCYDPAKRMWYCRPPGYHLGSLEKHDITEHEDGTITVSPSILHTEGDRQWHGFLEHGVWREV